MSDLSIEIALWDRFGWGPSDTESLTVAQLRLLHDILERQRS